MIVLNNGYDHKKEYMDHAEKALPEVEFELGGKKHLLCNSLGVLNRFEQKTGKNSLDDSTWINMTSQSLTALLWAAVNFKDPSVTYEQVEAQVTFKDIKTAGKIVKLLFHSSAPVLDEEEKNEERVSQ